MKTIQSISVGTLFFALLLWSKAGFGQARIDTTLGPSVRISILQPDFWYQGGQSNIIFRVKHGDGEVISMNDSTYDLPWSTFHKLDSVSASSYFRAKPDATPQGWTPWYKIILGGPVPVPSDFPFTFRPVNLTDQTVTITKQRGTTRKTSVDYYPATNLLAMFGANYPTDTTGFWFYKSSSQARTVSLDIYAKGELLNVTVGGITKQIPLVNSSRHYTVEMAIGRGLNQFKFWVINKSVIFGDPCFSVQFEGGESVPAMPVVRVYQKP
jgi:hypothetical protein